MINLMFRNTLRIFLCCIAVLSHLFVLQVATSRAQKGPPATPVKVAQINKVEIAPQVQLIGTAEPILTSVVAADIEGLVVNFSAGEAPRPTRMTPKPNLAEPEQI